MRPITLHVRYRPLRIGWCVRNANLDELREAVKLSHTLWGGTFNPVIPVDEADLARDLVRRFRVDCLYFLSTSSHGDSLAQSFSPLPWPGFRQELFVDNAQGEKSPAILDIVHPARHFFEENVKGREAHSQRGTAIEWQADDPLADVFLTTYGAYPTMDTTDINYEQIFRRALGSREVQIGPAEVVPATVYGALTRRELCGLDLFPDRGMFGRGDPGFYVGDCTLFDDLVNYWNLRACGIALEFYDSKHAERMAETVRRHTDWIRTRPQLGGGLPDHLPVWVRSYEDGVDLAPFGPNIVRYQASSHRHWNVRSPLMRFDDHSVLATVSEDERASVSFSLPAKPFLDHPDAQRQKVVASITPYASREKFTLTPPFFPKINEYLARHFFHRDGYELRSTALVSSSSYRRHIFR